MSAGVSVVPDLRFPHPDSHVPPLLLLLKFGVRFRRRDKQLCLWVNAEILFFCGRTQTPGVRVPHTMCSLSPARVGGGGRGVHFLSGSGVEKGGADGVAAARVKPEPPEECRRCFWRAGAEFGLGLKGKMGD